MHLDLGALEVEWCEDGRIYMSGPAEKAFVRTGLGRLNALRIYPKGVCSSKIELDVEEGRVHNIVYTGGCNGNLKALGALAEGMCAEELIKRLTGHPLRHQFHLLQRPIGDAFEKKPAVKRIQKVKGLKNEQQNRYQGPRMAGCEPVCHM